MKVTLLGWRITEIDGLFYGVHTKLNYGAVSQTVESFATIEEVRAWLDEQDNLEKAKISQPEYFDRYSPEGWFYGA